MNAVFTIICFLSLLGSPTVAIAEDVSVTATVDKTEATMEDYILLKLSVKGTREPPSLPDLPAFKVQSRGSSSQVSIVNGRMSSSVEHSYLLFPRKQGVFTVGPFFVRHKGRRVASNSVTLQVRKAAARSDQSRDIFVEAEVDNERPYQYEQLVYRFKFYRRVKVANASLTESPNFEGFLSESLGKEAEYQKVINGQAYVVTEIRQALFPTKTGVYEIGASTLRCDVVVQKRRGRRSFFDDSFFGFSETVPRVFTTKPITVMVQPLPAADKPRGFGGLVGNFMLASELSSRKLEVGESLTLTLTLRGSGNLKNNQEISVPKLDNFKVYDDKPVFEQSVSGTTVEGRLVIKKALVPLVEGKLTIPKIDVSFLNPETSRYVTVSTGPNVIDVAPASVKEQFQAVDAVQATGAQEAVRIIGHDILPVHTAIAVLSPARYRPSLLLVCGGLIVPVLIWVAVLLSLAVRRRNRSDQGLVRAKGAYGQFRKKMTEAGLALKQDDKRFYQLAPKALKEFVGDKLNIAGSALTADDLEKRLADRGVPAETIAELKACLDFFEVAQYGSSSHSAEEGQAVFNTMHESAAVLNKKMKRKSVISDR